MSDPTLKVITDESRPDGRLKVVGTMLLAAFGILLTFRFLPNVKAILNSGTAEYPFPVWRVLLSVHTDWIVMVAILIAGLDILAGRARGIMLGALGATFLVGTRVVMLFEDVIMHPIGVFRHIFYALGLVPFSVHTLGTLALNVIAIWAMVTLMNRQVTASVPDSSGKAMIGLMVGVGLCLWDGIINFVLL